MQTYPGFELATPGMGGKIVYPYATDPVGRFVPGLLYLFSM